MEPINPIKSDIITSVSSKNQGNYGTCYAHAVSRNFVRTLQNLGVIKYNYNEQFYDLFFTIITNKYSCRKGGQTFLVMFHLLDYLIKNYDDKIFSIRLFGKKCRYVNDVCPTKFLEMTKSDKAEFINKMKYLIDNNILFIGQVIYDDQNNITNNPYKAIKFMLDNHLQPVIEFGPSNYITKLQHTYNTTELNEKNIECFSNNNHAINLRKWFDKNIEFKNTWNIDVFSVDDIKLLNCYDGYYYKNITFLCLMFDIYELIKSKLFRKIVERINREYEPVIDPNIKIDENNNYQGAYNIFGLMHGEGKMTYLNGYKYDGYWKNGFRFGYGRLESFNYIYEGNWFNDMKSGQGKMIITNGNIYEGNWLNDMKTGQGRMTYTDGNIYEGNWLNDIISGQGRMTYTDGYEYNCKWKNDKPSEDGTMTYSPGNTYIGETKGSLMSGKGRMTYANGNIYEGDWLDNIKSGNGTMTYANGDIYEGEWLDNKKCGEGKMIYANGNIYEGDWFTDQKCGEGKMIYANRDIYEGYWFNDQKNVQGKMIYVNGDIYEGDWLNDMKSGKGTMTYANGDIYEGDWLNDMKLLDNQVHQKYIKYKNKYLNIKQKLKY
jgi:hypothetical protein